MSSRIFLRCFVLLILLIMIVASAGFAVGFNDSRADSFCAEASAVPTSSPVLSYYGVPVPIFPFLDRISTPSSTVNDWFLTSNYLLNSPPGFSRFSLEPLFTYVDDRGNSYCDGFSLVLTYVGQTTHRSTLGRYEYNSDYPLGDTYDYGGWYNFLPRTSAPTSLGTWLCVVQVYVSAPIRYDNIVRVDYLDRQEFAYLGDPVPDIYMQSVSVRFTDVDGNYIELRFPSRRNYESYRGTFYFVSDFNNFTESEIYNNGYISGFDKGYAQGYDDADDLAFAEGKNLGYDLGYNAGYNAGVEASNEYTFMNLFAALIDAPVNVFLGLTDFEVFGIKVSSFVLALLTIGLAIAIVRKFMGG